MSEALERFRDLLRRTPTHGFSEPIQLKMFIDGLRPQTKQLLDASAGVKIKLKTPKEATELIENMSANDHAILRDRTHQPTKKSLLELTSHDALLAQNKLLSKQLEILTETLGKLPTKLSIGKLHILLFCRLQVVPFMVKLMRQANAISLTITLKKFISRGINRGKGTLKKDFQASSKVLIISKDSGGHTLPVQ